MPESEQELLCLLTDVLLSLYGLDFSGCVLLTVPWYPKRVLRTTNVRTYRNDRTEYRKYFRSYRNVLRPDQRVTFSDLLLPSPLSFCVVFIFPFWLGIVARKRQSIYSMIL